VRDGFPPLSLDLGVRIDPEAVDLRKAIALYDSGKNEEAAKLFARHDSLEARIGESFGNWPDGTVAGLTQLSGLHPRSAAVQLNLGIARFWAGEGGAEDAWKSAASLEPDTAYAVTAGNLLHPDFARNLPIFVPSTEVPADIRRLTAPAQFALLEQRSRTGTTIDRLFYGAALQRLGKQVSAERVYAAAAKAAPKDPEAQVAAAVGLFDKARPAKAFSRLGPLSRAFPQAATVRFHLGLLLLWSGQVKEARRQLELVRTTEPGSPLVDVANRYLAELRKAGI
jgi:tetratricopeptide (TPR) repeat protein